jgi:hypothetical protein
VTLPATSGDAAVPPAGCYEVTVTGTLDPRLRAVFACHGLSHIVTSSVFVMPADEHLGLAGVAAALQARGLTVLEIRRLT